MWIDWLLKINVFNWTQMNRMTCVKRHNLPVPNKHTHTSLTKGLSVLWDLRQLFVNCHKEDLIRLLKQCCALISNSHTTFLGHICFSCCLTTLVVLYRVRSHSTRYQGVEGFVCMWNRVKNVPSCIIHTCYYIRANLRNQSSPFASFCCHFQGVYAAWTVIYRWDLRRAQPGYLCELIDPLWGFSCTNNSQGQERVKGFPTAVFPLLYTQRPQWVEVSWQCTVNIMHLWNEMGSWCRVVS